MVTTDGDIIKGYLDKKREAGTTVAALGGQRTFVQKSKIRFEFPLVGKSFMPAHFGQLPEQTMADLVAYIQTLK